MTIPNDGGWGKSGAGSGNQLEEGREGILSRISSLSNDLLVLACLALTSTLFFGLGLLIHRQAQPSKDSLWIEQLPQQVLPGSVATGSPEGQGTGTTIQSAVQTIAPPAQPAAAAAALPQTGNYVASRTGTKYYLPSCGTAKRIKDENRVWFATKAAAEAAGYEPSSTCKGL